MNRLMNIAHTLEEHPMVSGIYALVVKKIRFILMMMKQTNLSLMCEWKERSDCNESQFKPLLYGVYNFKYRSKIMSFKFTSRSEVADVVEGEGIAYFITCYTSSDAMPDEETRKAFIEAERAIASFEDIINSCD